MDNGQLWLLAAPAPIFLIGRYPLCGSFQKLDME